MTEHSSTYAGYQPAVTDAGSTENGGETSTKDAAMQSAQAGTQAVSDVAQTAAGQAKHVAGEAQNQAKHLVGEARSQLRSHAADQHRNAVSNLRSIGDELRSMADGEHSGVATDLVSQAADRTHGVADWLDGRQPEDLLEELRRLARRRPGAFLVGALAAGVIAGRLARGAVAAHSDDSDDSDGRDDRDGAAGAQHSYGSVALDGGPMPHAGLPT